MHPYADAQSFSCSMSPAHLRSWSLWEPCSHSISSLTQLPGMQPSSMAIELSPLALEASGDDGCTQQKTLNNL